MGRKCNFVKPDGAACKTPPLKGSKGSGRCYFHAAEMRTERKAAQSAGGRRNRAQALPSDAASLVLRKNYRSDLKRGELRPI
jgi:hypothetical protein